MPNPGTRAELKRKRKREVRCHTINMNRFTKSELELQRKLYPPTEEQANRPRTRGECQGGERPCPWVACHHHLWLDVSPKTGSIKLNFPDLDEGQMGELPQTCALDVADQGGVTLEEAGEHLNVTRERVRTLEVSAIGKVSALGETMALRDFADEGTPKRRLPVLTLVEPETEESDETEETEEFDWNKFEQLGLEGLEGVGT